MSKRGEYTNYKSTASYTIGSQGKRHTIDVFYLGSSSREARPSLMAQVKAIGPKVQNIRLGRIVDADKARAKAGK
jgi:hypothetical protein